MEVILLSQHPDYLKPCADLLNKQWKRSTSARVQSLERSTPELPDSLLLIEINDSQSQVIGHCRLTRVLEDLYGCWIGSVVIREDRRKLGYGKYIMEKAEEYAKVLQFSTVYLNTSDQQGFYEHLGYTYSNPVSSINFSSVAVLPRQGLVDNISNDENRNFPKQTESQNQLRHGLDSKAAKVVPCPPPPPPPPLPKT